MAATSQTFIKTVAAVAEQLALTDQMTLTGATTTSLTVASYPAKTNRANADSQSWEGSEVYLEGANANVTPNPNGIAQYTPSTGVYTPSVTYANAPAGTEVMDIFGRDTSILEIRRAINDALRKRRFECIVPLTFVTDNDIGSSADLTGSSKANATVTHNAVTQDNVIRGAQSRRVLATGANGYYQTPPLYVDAVNAPTWYVNVKVRANVGTARLIAYDVTNSAIILSKDWTTRGWGTLDFQFNIPATCTAIAFQEMSVSNADDTYWEEPPMAWPANSEELPLPQWMIEPGEFRGAERSFPATSRADKPNPVRITDAHVLVDRANPIYPFKLRLEPWIGITLPTWVKMTRTFPTLVADTDTTFMDKEWLECASRCELLERLTTRPVSEQTPIWEARLKKDQILCDSLDMALQPPTRFEISFQRPFGIASPGATHNPQSSGLVIGF